MQSHGFLPIERRKAIIPTTLDEIYRRFPLNLKNYLPDKKNSPFRRFYSFDILPLETREYLWHGLHRTGLDTAWFDQFRAYWQNVVAGIPLWGPEDFYFFRNIFRVDMDSIETPRTGDSVQHLKTWQNPQMIYQLFHNVYKESRQTQVNALSKLTTIDPKLFNFQNMLTYVIECHL